MKAWLGNYWGSFSFIGLVVATLFFAASVTPSLLPRPYYVQDVLSGFALAIGYGLGVGLVWFWKFLELPQPGEKLDRWCGDHFRAVRMAERVLAKLDSRIDANGAGGNGLSVPFLFGRGLAGPCRAGL